MSRFKLPENIREGRTTDIYFQRAQEVLEAENLNPHVTFEFFSNGEGVLCGMNETLELIESLKFPNTSVYALSEGVNIRRKEVVMRVHTDYRPFGLYETPLLGILSHSTGWATAAKELRIAAELTPVVSFGARHVHPLVAGRMEYAAQIGGCKGCASIEGAELAGFEPTGTMPHALILTMGNTVRTAVAFNQLYDNSIPRVVLVDTFKDEAEEALNVARELGGHLAGIRLDTPSERGRVTPEMVKEIRARLDQEGYTHVKIIVSGGLDPDRISLFKDRQAPVDTFGVGGYIANAAPIHFTADIKEVNGQAIAKRGRIPGITEAPKLEKVL